jgi:hypothetical protein
LIPAKAREFSGCIVFTITHAYKACAVASPVGLLIAANIRQRSSI